MNNMIITVTGFLDNPNRVVGTFGHASWNNGCILVGLVGGQEWLFWITFRGCMVW